ncbi:MAG: protease pro-enzyme activation domain-containing protein, partial [Candidatus Acidiferrum sp.]
MCLPKSSLRPGALLLVSILVFPVGRTAAQTTNVPARITQAVDEKNLVVLPGNVHPLARSEFDQGPVADAQPIKRILMLLRRSPDQEALLRQLLDDQQSKSSQNYHAWLTPEQFGKQFGPVDADIQTVAQWLTSQGFTDIEVGPGRTVIEFSGNVGQVRNAFHTQIHHFVVNNEERMANASDPQIPAALAPVVAGVVSLHNFPRTSQARVLGQFRRTIGRAGLEPLFTFPNPFNGKNFYGLGPGDFATIYNSKPLIAAGNDGTGQTIAIVGETNLNVQDVQQFRTMFGLPANFDATNVVLNGEDPGITSFGEEGEADLDVEWSGAAAPGATIKYVLSASTPASAGIDLSALYIVEHNLAGVMSESYGACEKDLGSAGNAFYNSLWEQAAAQGITVLLSSGDGGTAGCDNFNSQPVATQGLAVSGLASTPFNVSVGGTDFDQVNNWAAYWNPTNDPTGTSAKSYIPEIPWSENCAQIGLTGCGASAPNGSVNIVAGSGGASSLYGKPKWQMGVAGMPNDNHRDQPDISLFASPGFDGTGYVYCQSDQTISGARNCDLNASNGILDFGIVGGTSASAPAFAGIMALVNQYQAAHGGTDRQGNANYVLYALAKKAGASCTSSATEAAGCVFNDVTKGNSVLPTGLPGVGTNSVPCQGGSLNCSVSTTGSRGVLVDPSHTTTEAWTATAGYDMTTGLGTVNANNLATNWGSVSTIPTTTTLTLSPTTGITHGTGENVTVGITVKPNTGTGVPAGDVSLIATPVPPDGTTRGLDQFTLANGAVTGAKTQSLPGGTYTVSAHYAGDGTNAPSDSTPIQVTVGKESSQTFIVVPSFDSQGILLNGNATSVTYGSRYIIRMYVTDKNGVASTTGPPTLTCYQENVLTCPSGTVALTDNGALVDTGGGGPGVYDLNDFGYTRDLTPSLLVGVHSLVSTYSGDNSYSASSNT